VTGIINRLSNRYQRTMLDQLLFLPEVSSDNFTDAAFMGSWAAQLEGALQGTINGEGGSWEVSLNEGEEGLTGLLLTRGRHGIEQTSDIPIHFFGSPEYKQIAKLGEELNGFIETGAHIIRGEQRYDISSFHEAMEWLMTMARKGQNIQRYKGLGEMNPGQLWDTTINPETRRLMQVRIEDAVGADEIFTTLMGDHVEPRREFIERNALTVENLDV